MINVWESESSKQFHSKKEKKQHEIQKDFFKNFALAACVRYNSRAFLCRSSFLIWPYFVKKFHKLKSQGILEYCAKVSCCIAATVLLSEIFCWFSSVFYYGSMILLDACVRMWIFYFFLSAKYFMKILSWILPICISFNNKFYLKSNVSTHSNHFQWNISIFFVCIAHNERYLSLFGFSMEKKGKFCILTSATTFTCRYKRETFLSSITMSRIF